MKWKSDLKDLNNVLKDKKGLLPFVGDGEKYLNMFCFYRRIADKMKKKMTWTNTNEAYEKFNIKNSQF